jgi:thiol-disulfide isomerase/thioredoxin
MSPVISRPQFRLPIAVLLAVSAGCNTQPAADESTSPAVGVRLASWDETEQLIASHKGKVVVVDAWSTWCGPCVEEFPGLVALHNKYPGQVACISLNCNYTGLADEPPGADRAQVEGFLTKQGAAFDNVICTDPDEKLFAALGAAAVPIVRVYDRQGRLHKQFDNDANEFGDEGFSYERNIAPLVARLIEEPQ